MKKKSIVSERKRCGATCPGCRHPGYTMLRQKEAEGRTKTEFRCDRCGSIWSFGRDGGIYAELASTVE